MDNKKVIYSAAQPSVEWLTLGNYLGAVKNWADMQDDESSERIYCIADMHSITVRQVPADLRRRTVSFAAQYMAMGLSPQKNILYVQSHVPAHAQLCWILDCYTYVGEMNRMTQFKEKSTKHSDNVNMGLMNYPVLMAADILLYNTDLVPVGSDQNQHIEIARDIATRFNNAYSPTFKIPEGYNPKTGARLKSLQEPDKKMSKSDENENATIYFGDEPETIRRKIKRAVTDSGNTILMSEDKPAISNLLTIFANCAGVTVAEAERHFEGKNYAQLKNETADAVVSLLEPMQNEYKRLIEDKAYLEGVLADGAQKASYKANKMLFKVMKKVGFYQGK